MPSGRPVAFDGETVLESTHIFSMEDQDWICREELFVSDEVKEPHYGKNHANNIGKMVLTPYKLLSLNNLDAQQVLPLEVDVTFLREQNLVKATKGKDGDDYYEVDLELEFFVHGRDMRWKATWNGRKVGECNFSLAAALQPGTE